MTISDYDRDFYAWSQEQADLLRAQRFRDLDVDHLIEELESMGARERRELTNRLKVLLAHLLKWRHQPHLQSRSWAATIKEQRMSIQDLLEDNPSLERMLDQQTAKAYRLARLLAVGETNLEEATFPETCPFSREEIRDEGFYPPSVR
jgi:hypothetical protein